MPRFGVPKSALLALLTCAGILLSTLGVATAHAQDSNEQGALCSISGTAHPPAEVEPSPQNQWTADILRVNDDATLAPVDKVNVSGDGTYLATNLSPGVYTVRVSPDGPLESQLGPTFLGGTTKYSPDSNLVVSDTCEVTGNTSIELAFTAPLSSNVITNAVTRKISGTVSIPSDISLNELSSLRVYLRPFSDYANGTWDSFDLPKDENGVVTSLSYELTNVYPAEYLVEFWAWDPALNLVSEFWGNSVLESGATIVDVRTADASGISPALEHGKKISGQISLPQGAPSEWMNCVSVRATYQDESSSDSHYGNSDYGVNIEQYKTGLYEITGLSPNLDYALIFYADSWCVDSNYETLWPNLAPQFWNNQTTTPTLLDMSTGDKTNINATLKTGLTVSGQVSVPSEAKHLIGYVEVWAWGQQDGSYFSEMSAPSSIKFDPNTGSYVVAGLLPGSIGIVATVDRNGAYDPSTGNMPFVPRGLIPNQINVTIASDTSSQNIRLTFMRDATDSSFPEEVLWLADLGITRGWVLADGLIEFRPFAGITREQMAAFLYRYAGQPNVTLPGTSPFRDLPTSHGFYKEVVWLASTGITRGWDMPDGTKEFRGHENITREQMAAFLYRYAGQPNVTLPGTSPFRDLPTSHGFYKEVVWLASTGITRGWDMPDGTKEFRGWQGNTREQMAAFLYRYSVWESSQDGSGGGI